MIFMGATTENPAFELNNALLSRARIYKLESLDADSLEQILARAMGRAELPGASAELQGSGQDQEPSASAEEGVLATIAHAADGDARLALNILEIALSHASDARLTKEGLKQVLGSQYRRFDQVAIYSLIKFLPFISRFADQIQMLRCIGSQECWMGAAIHFMSRVES